MVYGDHIAITSGDKSTTGREVSVVRCSFAVWIGITCRDFCETYRRSGLDPGILLARLARLGGERDLKCCSPLSTDGNL